MVLRSMEAALPAERFLIWAQEEGKDHSGCGYGRLRSASGNYLGFFFFIFLYLQICQLQLMFA